MPDTWETNSKFILEKLGKIEEGMEGNRAELANCRVDIAKLDEKICGHTRIIAGVATFFAAIVSFFTAFFTR